MIDLKLIRKNSAEVEKTTRRRKPDFDLSRIAELDARRLEKNRKGEELKTLRNRLSEKISKEKPSPEERTEIVERVRGVNAEIKEVEEQTRKLEEATNAELLCIPNLLTDEVPEGADESSNKIVKTHGEIPAFDFKPKSHMELGEEKGIMDFPRGVKMAHSRFSLLKNQAALLERALANFMIDLQVREHGYEEHIPPLLVNRETMTGTGQLPKFEEDLFKTTTGLYLIPTAEVPLTNIYAGEVLPEDFFPKKMAALTPCFRSEAGSYGKDTKGYLRQHQFSKVELVWLTLPDQSEEAHERLVRDAETVLELLEIPYRTLLLCAGDTGFSAAKCFDIEVWLPSQNSYREISSCSNCRDFQTRRAQIRAKPSAGGKPFFPHSLNGSGLAVGRALIAVMENFQCEDGSIVIPRKLIPYMHGLTKI